MTRFFILYNYANFCVLYVNIISQNKMHIIWHINYIIKKYNKCNFCVLYTGDDISPHIINGTNNCTLSKTDKNYELFFYLHMLKHNNFYNNGNVELIKHHNLICEIYDTINYGNKFNPAYTKHTLNYSDIIEKILRIIFIAKRPYFNG